MQVCNISEKFKQKRLKVFLREESINSIFFINQYSFNFNGETSFITHLIKGKIFNVNCIKSRVLCFCWECNLNNEDDLNLYNCILKYQNLLQKFIISRFQSNFILPEIFHLNKKTGNPIFVFI